MKFVTCLHIILFLNRRSIIFCSFLQMGVRGGRGGLVVCGRHNGMILNIKTYFHKKVTLLALVQKQPAEMFYVKRCS